MIIQLTSFVEDSSIFDGDADRAAEDALDAICHHEAANMRSVVEVGRPIESVVIRVDLLHRDNMVIVGTIGTAISAALAARAAGCTEDWALPAAAEPSADRVDDVGLVLVVKLLQGDVSTAEDARAHAEAAAVLAAARRLRPSKNLAFAAVLIWGGLFNFPVLAAAQALVAVEQLVPIGGVPKPRRPRTAEQPAILTAIWRLPHVDVAIQIDGLDGGDGVSAPGVGSGSFHCVSLQRHVQSAPRTLR